MSFIANGYKLKLLQVVFFFFDIENPCKENQFSCLDGSCVPFSVTCDGVLNCKDGSDEPDICCKYPCSFVLSCLDGPWVTWSFTCVGLYVMLHQMSQTSALSIIVEFIALCFLARIHGVAPVSIYMVVRFSYLDRSGLANYKKGCNCICSIICWIKQCASTNNC